MRDPPGAVRIHEATGVVRGVGGVPTCRTRFIWMNVLAAGIAASSVAMAQEIVRQPLPAPSMPQTAQPPAAAQPQPSATLPQAPVQPLAAPDAPPEMAGAAGLEQHLNHVQDILTDQENIDPDAVKQAEDLDWSEAPVDVVDGDFPAQHDAESKIGWTAPGAKDDKPKVRKPKVDLKAMTRVKLNEKGSTVLDLTKGRVIHRF